MSELYFNLDNALLGLFAGDGSTPDDVEEEPTPEVDPVSGWRMPNHGIREGRMFHVPHGREYYEENSAQGIEEAKREDYDSIDLDMQWTKADPNCPLPDALHGPGGVCRGHAVNTHWGNPLMHGFRDPKGLIPRGRRIGEMTWPEVARLQAGKNNQYRIDLMATQFARTRAAGLVASAEAKWNNSNQYRMNQLMREATAARCRTIVKSAYSAPIRAAKKAGFQTRYTKDHRPGM